MKKLLRKMGKRRPPSNESHSTVPPEHTPPPQYEETAPPTYTPASETAPPPEYAPSPEFDKSDDSNVSPMTYSALPAEAFNWERNLGELASVDRDAMIALFEASDGVNWIYNHNWCTGAKLSQWHGVIVNDTGRVVELRLMCNNLRGHLPKELGNLSALQYLFLNYNELDGTIPEELGLLSALKELWLNNNGFSGPIPAVLGNLSALRKLYMSETKLSGLIPKEMENLKELVELHVCNTNLSGPIPKELGNLSALQKLDMSDTKLSGPVPEELGNLSFLQELWLSNNGLSGPIPKELGNLIALKTMRMGNTKLAGPIPKELENLSALQQLWLNDNGLSGSIPKELEKLGALQELWLNNNLLGGSIPLELGNLGALRKLRLNNNNFSGVIPQELEKLVILQELFLNNNVLSGPIPKELGNLRALRKLWLHNNGLSGPVPKELGKLICLQELWLKNNHLSGALPKELGNLFALRKLYTSDTKLSGGRRDGESLDMWKARLREPLRSPKEGSPARHDAPARGEEAGVPSSVSIAVPGEAIADEQLSSQEEKEVEQLFRAQVASLSGLNEYTRENRASLEELKSLVAANDHAFGGVPKESLRELDNLVQMAKTVEELASSRAEDKHARQKERALTPDSKGGAYYMTVRSGICNAYLAASVIGSNMVSTSKTGVMGAAGKAVTLLANAAPMIVGLSSVGAALLGIDHRIQTKKLVKISTIATDTVECCTIAREVALRLASELTDASVTNTSAQREAYTEGRFSTGAVSGSGEVDADADAAIAWLAEELANYDPQTERSSSTSSENGLVKEGRRVGEAHLKMILNAVVGGCMLGATDTAEKISCVVRVILPKSDINEVSSSSNADRRLTSPEGSPVPEASSTDVGNAKLAEELAAMKAKLEAVTLDNKDLRSTVKGLEKRIPKPQEQSDDWVDTGGGHALSRTQRKVQTKEQFFEEAEQSSGRSEDLRPVTWRDFEERLAQQKACAEEDLDAVDSRLSKVEGRLEGRRRKK